MNTYRCLFFLMVGTVFDVEKISILIWKIFWSSVIVYFFIPCEIGGDMDSKYLQVREAFLSFSYIAIETSSLTPLGH